MKNKTHNVTLKRSSQGDAALDRGAGGYSGNNELHHPRETLPAGPGRAGPPSAAGAGPGPTPGEGKGRSRWEPPSRAHLPPLHPGRGLTGDLKPAVPLRRPPPEVLAKQRGAASEAGHPRLSGDAACGAARERKGQRGTGSYLLGRARGGWRGGLRPAPGGTPSARAAASRRTGTDCPAGHAGSCSRPPPRGTPGVVAPSPALAGHAGSCSPSRSRGARRGG